MALIPLTTPTHDAPELLKATLNVFVATELSLNDPEYLTDETTAQISLYTHLVQHARTFGKQPGA
jgi:hypothetical protein